MAKRRVVTFFKENNNEKTDWLSLAILIGVIVLCWLVLWKSGFIDFIFSILNKDCCDCSLIIRNFSNNSCGGSCNVIK